MYSKFFKRIVDFTLALCAIIVLSPVLIIMTLLLYIFNSGAGVIFSQDRVGYKCKIFKVYKFKTMNEKRDANGKLLPDLQRVTPFGKFVRKTSLDELPQLFNVLKGDMSLIGPRPLLVQYLPLYSKEQLRRHDVRPGISGLAQVNGRNNTTWKQRFENDVWYVDHISFLLDIKIIWKTVVNVLGSKNIESASCGQFTMEPFNGNN
jgi:lipopolysaccharide/colanic/teichoic acid biosynthesis glycosyltransferase